MRIYQTWLKKHLVSFLSPQKGHILISQRVLQTQISAGTELRDHSRNLACSESSCLELGILSASLWMAGCQNRRGGERGAPGARRKPGRWEPQLWGLGVTAPPKPHQHRTNPLPARPWPSLLQGTHSRQPLPQYKRVTPTYVHGLFMKNTWIWPFWSAPQCVLPVEGVRDPVQSLLNQTLALTKWGCSTGAASATNAPQLLLSICFSNRRKLSHWLPRQPDWAGMLKMYLGSQ